MERERKRSEREMKETIINESNPKNWLGVHCQEVRPGTAGWRRAQFIKKELTRMYGMGQVL